ncbi:MAG: thioredoxin domain-containing protein [Spirochaetia bacterium]|nr:thioredoxin domain-containing protein [Spirochaetia bacterium]
MSSDRKPNRLIEEKSPYLLQHAYNPVDWFPYGDAAFAKAASEDKLVLVSIGYATCHWCHVMERESFEDEDTARLLNDRFVAIKVDREERPDVDQIYMKALQATGQHGGWPLNMFVMPDRRPVAGGTYFPPVPTQGRPSFKQILDTLDEAWRSTRDKVVESAEALTGYVRSGPGAGAPPNGSYPGAEALDAAAGHYERSFDAYRGGFLTNGPNKFPPSMGLLFLLRRYNAGRNARHLEIVERTLDAMKRGGIYDQVGGGLSRYSTDHDWLVPHFEKMLYDNALFALALVETYKTTQNDRYRAWALDVFDYLFRDMTSPDGAFYSAEDADSEGEEGKFYLWTSTEIQSVLSRAGILDEDIRRLMQFWGVTMRGNFEGRSILNEPIARDEFVRGVGMDVPSWDTLVLRARSVLLDERSKRIRPLRDDKILVSWNALAITALSRAACVFGEPKLAQHAVRAAEFIWNAMYKDGTLYRRHRDGDARHFGTLADYAQLGCAYVDLYRATFNPVWLGRATELGTCITKYFEGPGAYYDSSNQVNDVLTRMIDGYDGVEPSGNSAAARLFLMLASYGIASADNRARAEKIFSFFRENLAQYGTAYPAMLGALDRLLFPEVEFVVTEGDDDGNGVYAEMIAWIRTHADADAAVAGVKKGAGVPGSDSLVPLLEGRLTAPKTTAWVCRNFACELPAHSVKELVSRVS